jgi:hypothetical protein
MRFSSGRLPVAATADPTPLSRISRHGKRKRDLTAISMTASDNYPEYQSTCRIAPFLNTSSRPGRIRPIDSMNLLRPYYPERHKRTWALLICLGEFACGLQLRCPEAGSFRPPFLYVLL